MNKSSMLRSVKITLMMMMMEKKIHVKINCRKLRGIQKFMMRYDYYVEETLSDVLIILNFNIFFKQFQFVLTSSHALYNVCFGDCGFPRLFSLSSVIQSAIFFSLFTNFYLQTYEKPKRR